MSQDIPGVHAADTPPSAANQDLEEDQESSMMSSRRDLNIIGGTFFNVRGSLQHNSAHSRSGS